MTETEEVAELIQCQLKSNPELMAKLLLSMQRQINERNTLLSDAASWFQMVIDGHKLNQKPLEDFIKIVRELK